LIYRYLGGTSGKGTGPAILLRWCQSFKFGAGRTLNVTPTPFGLENGLTARKDNVMNRIQKNRFGGFSSLKRAEESRGMTKDPSGMRPFWKGRISLIAVFIFASLASLTFAQAQPSSHSAERIRHVLVTLPYYSVFDNLTFRIEAGGKVVLMGQVTRPTLRSEAENVVKRLEEVTTVDNQIEVLPLSTTDDWIRLATYRAIYYDSVFTRYAIRVVPPIHIIVNNGNVTLEGAVASKSDRNVANILANSVPGVFSVANNLVVDQDEETA
jgi:hyperosmotically inducible protein